MSLPEPLYHLFNMDAKQLTARAMQRYEQQLLKHICKGIKEYFRRENQQYFCCMKFSVARENKMLEETYVSLLINEILSTKQYTLRSIAKQVSATKKTIRHLAMSSGAKPATMLLWKIIVLHSRIKPDLYEKLIKNYKPIH